MRLAHALTFALLLSLPFAAVAKKTPAAEAKQFIDQSLIVYPNAVPGLTFVEKKYDPASWTSGVGLHYVITTAPDIRLDVFVYPLGRAPVGQALDAHIKDVQRAVQLYQDRGTYSYVVIGKTEEFNLGAPAPAAEPSPADAPKPAAAGPVVEGASKKETAKNGADPAFEKFIVDTLAPQPIPGRKVSMGFDYEGKPRQSLGYVFNKQLFLFKIRITAETARMNPVQFNQLADDAARALIPAIEVHNAGTCGNIVIAADEKDPEAGAQMLITEMARTQREGCSSALGKYKAPAGTGQETIVYPADTWKSN